VSEESIFRTIRFIVIVGLFLILISGCAEPRVMPSCELGTPECEAAWDDWNDYEDRIERKRKLDNLCPKNAVLICDGQTVRSCIRRPHSCSCYCGKCDDSIWR
jgi:hypothetical protein